MRPHSTHSKRKCFHLIEESICTFYEVKSRKKQATTQYFRKRVILNRSNLDFHRTSKILCQKSGCQIHWSLLDMLWFVVVVVGGGSEASSDEEAMIVGFFQSVI